jgi:CBS domain-containing protein
VPVVDADNHLLGILTDRDLLIAALTRGGALADHHAGDVMTAEVFTCARGDSLETAARIMADNGVRRLPVVDAARHIVGLLSLTDLATAYAVAPQEPGVQAHDLARTLRAVCLKHENIA